MPTKRKKRGASRGAALAREVRIVLSTAPERVARALALSLVTNGSATCVNVLPGVRSVYRWKGRVEAGRESLLVIKTPRRDVEGLLLALKRQHPYEVPEAVVLRPIGGLEDYLRWVADPRCGGRT